MNFQEIKEKISLRHKEKKFKISIFGSSPSSDWIVILGIFFVLFAASMLGSYFYYQNAWQTIEKVEIGNEAASKLKYEEISSFLKTYETRQKNFDRYLNAGE